MKPVSMSSGMCVSLISRYCAHPAKAVRKGRVGEVEMMITRLGMDVNLRCKHRRGTSTSNVSLYLRLNCVSFATEKGGTILHVAARHGHLDLMRWVLQLRQVEVDAIDNRGKTVRAAHAVRGSLAARILLCAPRLLLTRARPCIAPAWASTPPAPCS